MAKSGNGKRQPKYHSILPLLLRREGAAMAEMMKAARTNDSHDIQNLLVSVKASGHSCERRLVGKGDAEVAKWFAKASTVKSNSPVNAKSTKPQSKPKRAKSVKPRTNPMGDKENEPAHTTTEVTH